MIYSTYSSTTLLLSFSSMALGKSFYQADPAGSTSNAPPITIYDGRGYFDYTHIDIDGSDTRADLHRFKYGGSTISRPKTDDIGVFTKVRSLDFSADYSFPNPIPPTLFSGANSPDRSGIAFIYQGLKRTSYEQWSQVQTLSPPTDSIYESDFGMSVKLDHKHHRNLAVGCPGCNSSSTSTGQVYLYSTNREGKYWSQTQVLGLSASGYDELGNELMFHDNVFLASVKITDHSASKIGSVGFSRGVGLEDPFSPQQVFTVPHGDVTGSAVFEETIVLANYNATSSVLPSTGAVYILYPSTERFGLKPAGKPRPVQWSVQQVLHSPSPIANEHFGSSISLDRHTLVVTARTSDSAFIYKREEVSGKWSQQQVLSVTGAQTSSVVGSKLAVGGSTGVDTYFYSLTTKWDCLVLVLEDHFFDGWDIAELLVNAPDGTQDFFAPSCSYNQVKVRYCPNLESDGGLYSFKIANANKAKFPWEIQYRVFEEATGVWHTGNANTKMDFHWDPEALAFKGMKMENLFQNTTTCQPCKTRPTEKPTPTLRRALKSGDDQTSTHFPTVSPAPTLAVANTINWRYMTLHATSPWFDTQHKGTEYYISDPNGHRLITSGTLCPGETQRQCWVDLPEGDYVLRVGGALNPHVSSNTFTYCKQVNQQAALSQMMFRIKDDDCTIKSFASNAGVCSALLGTNSFSLVLNFNILVTGASVTTITGAEKTVFADSFSSLFPGTSSFDVSLLSVTPTGLNSVLVNANLRVSSASSGYNLLDSDQENAFELYLKSRVEDPHTVFSLIAAFASGSIASGFLTAQSAEILDYRVVDSLETLPASAEFNPDVVNYAETETINYYTSTSSSPAAEAIESASNTGYLLASVGILFAVGLFAFIRRRPIATNQQTATIIPTESSHHGPVPTHLNLTPRDLKELAKMEQAYFQIMDKK
jgi:hypothetical protein